MNEEDQRAPRTWSRGRDALASRSPSMSPSMPVARFAAAERGAASTMFGVGSVLATGFRVWFRNLLPFVLITALCYAPPWIWVAITTHRAPTVENLQAASQALVIATFLTIPIGIVVAATLTYGVVMELNGRRASIGACVATGLSRFFPALGVAVLTSLCVTLGLCALLVPGFIVMCMAYVATPVVVLERVSIGRALNRSGELTKGRRLKIFGLLLVLLAMNFASILLARTLATSPAHTLEAVGRNLSRLVYVNFADIVLTGSIGAVMASVAYYYLRAEKDGTSTAELAAIFD